MKNSLLLAASVTAAALVPPAVAKAALPTAASVEQFAKCAVGHYEGAELLATQPGTAEEAEVIAEYGRRACIAPAVDLGVLRGAVAEELFKADFGSIGAQPRRDLIEIFTIDLSELEALDQNARKRIDYVAFGTCVAASDPKKSSMLLTTTVESAEEKAVFTELVPHFTSCLAQGERFTFTRGDLRSSLAEGAYRLALAHTLDDEVVVTGTRDPSKRVQCRRVAVTGSRFRDNVCLTEAQWAKRGRAAEYAAEEIKRQTRQYEEIQTTIETLTRFTPAQ